MLVNSISLDDVKCFPAQTDLDFTAGRSHPHKWVVVYGDNGLGKSTLLRAIGLALVGQPALNALLPSAEGWVRGESRRAAIYADFTKGSGDKSPGAPRMRSASIAWALIGSSPLNVGRTVIPANSIHLLKHPRHLAIPHGLRTRLKRLDEDARLFAEHIASDEPKRGWLVCGYGPHRRLSGAASELAERIPPDGRAAGKSEVVEVVTEEGTIGLTADQKLTGPDFGLSTTRDVLATDMAAEIERLRAKVREKQAKPAEKKRLRALEAEYEQLAPATPTYAGVERWREGEARIRRANEEAARAEGGRR